MLRTSVDFERSADESARTGATECAEFVRCRVFREEDRFLRAELPVGGSRRRAIAAAGGRAAARARDRGRLRVVRRICRRAAVAFEAGAVEDPAARALPSEIDGAAAVGEGA